MAEVPQGAVWLITGIPGAGKSTVAHALANRLASSVHIEVDLLREFVVGGRVGPGDEPRSEADRQLLLAAIAGAKLANHYADAGFTPVVDDVVLRLQYEAYLSELRPSPVRLVVLAPGVGVAMERDASRDEQHLQRRFAYLGEGFRTQMEGVGLWVDNAGLTVDETVEHLLAHAEASVVRHGNG
jgi:gluconate kinase